MEGYRTVQDSIHTGLKRCTAELEQETQARRIVYLLFTKYRADTLFPSGYIICTINEVIYEDLGSALKNVNLNGRQISYIVAIDVDVEWVEINDGVMYFSQTAPKVPDFDCNIMLPMGLLHNVYSLEGLVIWRRDEQQEIKEP